MFIDDVVAVNLWFLDHPEKSGIFNLGTGRAQPFNDVALAVVNALRTGSRSSPPLDAAAAAAQGLIEYIPFPDALRGKYQCYTQADLDGPARSRLRPCVRRCPDRRGPVHGGPAPSGRARRQPPRAGCR